MSRTEVYKRKSARAGLQGLEGSILLPGPPAKALFNRLAQEAGLRSLELYRIFLSDCISTNHAPNSVAALNEELTNRFFGGPEEEPRYCSIEKVNDLSHLRLASGVTFVIYQKHSSFGVLRVFDNRVQLTISYGCYEPEKALVFLLHDCGEGVQLYELIRGEASFEAKDLRDLTCRLSLSGSELLPVGDCLLKSLGKLLGVKKIATGGVKWTLLDVLEKHREVWNVLGVPFVLSEHVGVQTWKWKQRNVNRKERQRFKVFLTVYDRADGKTVPWEKMKGVCISYHGFLTLLDEDNLSRILKDRRIDTAARPEEKLNPFPHSSHQEALDEREFVGQGMAGVSEGKKVDYRSLTPCDCSLCQESPKYQDNMDQCGAQKLYTVDWDLFTYMKAFGLEDPSHVSAVKKALVLSVSGMDLETSTVSLSADELPSKSRGFAAPHEKITSSSRAGDDFEMSQRILLIGHIDNQDVDGMGSELEIFESGRSPEGVRDSVHRYVRYLVFRQYKMELKKRLLLRPLLEFATDHRESFLAYSESKGVEPSQALASWKDSLLGRFERRLELLCKKYYVYAFNGAGFDFPLLCGHIATAPWLRRHWSIQRSGSSVTMLSMAGRCIYFRDLKKMLGPGSSLASLASTVGLEQSKMQFPYGILKGYGECLEESTLPPYGPRWFDVLTQSMPADSVVAQAHKAFADLNCQSIREYLYEYLKVDLQLLLRSAHLLLENFCNLTGISPVECDKSTLSSYSMYCSQMFLVSGKKPGAFCNNNPAIYNVLRNSLRGGLTMVTRTSVNSGETEPLNQPHLDAGDLGEKAKAIHYLDVSGLYSAAELAKCAITIYGYGSY